MTAPIDPIRSAALEEAAKVAERWLESSWRDEVFAARSIADAIRALKDRALQPGTAGPVAWQPNLEDVAEALFDAKHGLDDNWRQHFDYDDIMRQARAVMLLYAAPQPVACPEGWKPIDDETPLDVPLLLGWWRKWPTVEWETASGLAGSTKGKWLHGQATHWQPLPAPPSSDNSEGT